MFPEENWTNVTINDYEGLLFRSTLEVQVESTCHNIELYMPKGML